jgi:hypothetical protein
MHVALMGEKTNTVVGLPEGKRFVKGRLRRRIQTVTERKGIGS